MADQKTTITDGPADPSVQSHRTPAIPQSFTSPLGADDGSQDMTPVGSIGALIGEDDTEATPADGENQQEALSGQEDSAVAPDATTSRTQNREQPPDPRLAQKAELYDYIMSDPTLSSAVVDRFALQTGTAPQQQTAPEPAEQQGSSEYVSRAEYDKLQQSVRALATRNAQHEWNQFTAKHPDAVQHQDRIANYVVNHGLPLEDSYRLAIAQNGGGSSDRQQQATVPSVEAGPGGGGMRTSTAPDVMQMAQDRVKSLPQSKNRFEDALNIVAKAALEKHGYKL